MSAPLERFSLDFLTALDLSAADFIHLAADLGLGKVSLMVRAVEGYPDFGLERPGAATRAALEALQARAIAVDMAEPFFLFAQTRPDDYLHALDQAALFKADCVNFIARTADLGLLAAQMARGAEEAAARGLKTVTEISKRGPLMRLAQAHDFLRSHDLPITVELDALHFYHAGGRLEDIAPHAQSVGRIQLCDVKPQISPAAEWHEASRDRALPDQGCADLRGFLRALPRDITIGLEIPQEGIPGAQAARRALAAAKGLFPL